MVDSLGLTISELVSIHTRLDYRSVSDKPPQLTTTEFQNLLTKLAQSIEQPNTNSRVSYQLLGIPWPDEPDIHSQARNLMDSALKFCLDTQGKFESAVAIVLFFKLLAQDNSNLKEAPRFFSTLRQPIETSQVLNWDIAFGLNLISSEQAKLLVTFLNDEIEAVRLGAVAFWATAIQASFRSYGSTLIANFEIKWVQEMRFDWEVGVSLLQAEHTIRRQQGIILLTFSDYPIAEAPRRKWLLDMMMNSKNEDEDEVWSQLLRKFPIQAIQESHWCSLLESILAYPQHYSSHILSGAMERYQELKKDKDVDFLEQYEAELGLP